MSESTNTQTIAAAPPRFSAAERLALTVLLTANFTLAVDFSILNVALPRIGRELGFATEYLQWIVTSFALCAAGFTLFFGRVADLFGRRRLFLIGMALLGAASLTGGLAHSPTVLIIARIAQGIATAMVTPAALSLMTTTFPEGPARSRALGLNGALMAAGFTAGAVLGGLLTGMLSWRWAFFINVIVTVLVLATAPFVLTERPVGNRPKLDLLGTVTVTAALVALVYGATTAGDTGWSTPAAWGSLVVAVTLFVIFWVVEHRVSQPLVAPNLLRRSNVAWGNTAGLLAFATETSLVFLLTLYLQDVLGFGAVTAGLILAVLGGLIAPRIIGKINSKRAIVRGFLVQCVATAPLVFLGAHRGWVIALLILSFVGGVANLVAIVGYNVTSTAGIPGHQQGLATGLVTLSQQTGITLGTPIMSAIAASQLNTGLLHGLRLAIGVNAALCLAAALLVGTILTLPAATREADNAAA